MYTSCLFCHTDLGANHHLSTFPVGRRLAFDPARGRLWVVCRKCERWNLSPVEERWEAIEECEKLYSDTRLRVSTGNIGLARIREGLELVRIGAPLRPEMAAWRYGDQFGRRRTRHMLYTGLGVAAAVGIVIVGPMTGVIAGSSWGLWNVFTTANSAYQARRVRASLRVPGYEDVIRIRQKQLARVSIVRADDRWALRLPFEAPGYGVVPLQNGRKLQRSWLDKRVEISTELTGADAIAAAGKLLPAINAAGAKKDQVESAVRMLGDGGDVDKLFSRYASTDSARLKRPGKSRALLPPGHLIGSLPMEVRLALEMATHEDSERRALEGELALLEAEWKAAEEIAAIADDMFVSDDARTRLANLKSESPANEDG